MPVTCGHGLKAALQCFSLFIAVLDWGRVAAISVDNAQGFRGELCCLNGSVQLVAAFGLGELKPAVFDLHCLSGQLQCTFNLPLSVSVLCCIVMSQETAAMKNWKVMA